MLGLAAHCGGECCQKTKSCEHQRTRAQTTLSFRGSCVTCRLNVQTLIRTRGVAAGAGTNYFAIIGINADPLPRVRQDIAGVCGTDPGQWRIGRQGRLRPRSSITGAVGK